MSLAPAVESATPAAAVSAEALPSVGLPSGEPSVAAVAVEYTFGADDGTAFADAYRAEFSQPDLSDADVDTAGARLCTYLMRHADSSGMVDGERAVAEAEFNEPGYAREAWVAAFTIATQHYCGQFSISLEFSGG